MNDVSGLMEPVQQQQQCVWSLIKECVPDAELPEIRAMLGDALIDMYTEISSEVSQPVTCTESHRILVTKQNNKTKQQNKTIKQNKAK